MNPAPSTHSPAPSPPPDSWEITPLTTQPVLGLLLGGGGALQHTSAHTLEALGSLEWEEGSQTLPVSEMKALSGL